MQAINFTSKPKSDPFFVSNPLIRLILLLFPFILSFIFDNPVYLLILLMNLLIIASFTGNLQHGLMFLKFMGIFAIIFFVVVVLLNRSGNTILFYYNTHNALLGPIVITLEAILYNIETIMRIFIAILSFGLINYIVSPDDLMKAFTKLHLPYSMTLLITLSFRFFQY